MTIKKKISGRHYSDPASARAKLQELDAAIKAATAAKKDHMDQCTANGLVTKVKVSETLVTPKPHMRGKYETVWCDQVLSIELQTKAKQFA